MFHGPPHPDWFDGHLDLAYIALHGRDLARSPEDCGGTLQPACLTFPALAAAGVTRAFSTLFVRQRADGVGGDYCFTDMAEAHAAALRQLHMHHAWQSAGLIQLAPQPVNSEIPNLKSEIARAPLQIHLAMEGAAPMVAVEDADSFHAAGVRMVSLAWAEGSQWSGGDQSGGDITYAGQRLVRRLNSLGIIHDVSHLSDRAFWSLLDLATSPVVASHSNCRALLPGAKFPERHLSDDQLRALAARPNARIGINLFARFILPPDQLAQRRATIADLLRHLDHIEQITARRDLLALGTDFDSGFTPDLLPADLQGPHHLPRLAQALSAAGWPDPDITRFANAWQTLLT